jgi:hypothetical protein
VHYAADADVGVYDNTLLHQAHPFRPTYALPTIPPDRLLAYLATLRIPVDLGPTGVLGGQLKAFVAHGYLFRRKAAGGGLPDAPDAGAAGEGEDVLLEWGPRAVVEVPTANMVRFITEVGGVCVCVCACVRV